MTGDVTSGPGVTALGLAAARSVDSSRSDRLIEDRFARSLYEAAGAELGMLLEWPAETSSVTDTQALHLHGSRYIGLRTRFYDDVISAAVAAGAEQVILLGAGLDTRAFRLSLPSALQLFELDQANVLNFKESALDRQQALPQCKRTTVEIDLREDWPAALNAKGFDRRATTAWVAEGLLPYLPPDAQIALLSNVQELSAPLSVIAFDRIVGDIADRGRLRNLSTRSGIDMESLLARGEAQDLRGFLVALSWKVAEESVSTLAERYGRDLSDPFPSGSESQTEAEPPWLDTMFLTAHL